MTASETSPPIPPRTLVFKIEQAQAWRAAQDAGAYHGAALDLRDGFIHLSAADQVQGTLARYFAGCDGLILVAIDVARCGDALKWEVSRDGAAFPHLYASLPMDAVVGVHPLPADGTLPVLPEWGLSP